MPDFKTSKGQYTGAIYGFLNILLRLIKEQQPTHIAAAFDLKGPTFRHEMFDGYKATRKPMDEELAMQVEPLKEVISLMGIKIVSLQGYEGDDILGTLAKRFDEDCIIVTGDRDSFQLVSPTTRVFRTKKGVSDVEVIDEARLLADGFTTSQFIDYKALMGDASDNIPGIAGVGEKTAKQLLEKYGSLDEILNHADEIKGKVGENVRAGRESALLSRKLATINTDVPVECTLNDIVFKDVYPAELRAKLFELEINSLVPRMKFEEGGEENAMREQFKKQTVKLTSLDQMREAIKGETIAIYIGEDVCFSTDGNTEYVVDCAKDLLSEGPPFEDAIAELKRDIESRLLICYDYKSLSKQYGFEAENVFDIMIAAHLVRGSAPIKSLQQVLGADGFEVGAAEIFAEYGLLKKGLTENGLEKLYYEVELPLSKVLKAMEDRGVRVSIETLKSLEIKYGRIIDDLTKRIYDASGCEFNILSPKQLGEVLFERLGLPHGKKTKTGYSVSEDVLQSLAAAHPVIPLILEYRHYSKLQSTYVVGLQPLIRRGRIHTEYNQCITMTGRLSSTNPNLQNLPARSEEAKDIKSAFLASEGNVLVSADYSQIELRLMAHASGDETLIDAFNKGLDIHAITAANILGIPLSEVTSSQRREAKAVNFGIIYGISGFGLAENLAIPQYKAREYINNYFFRHPKVREYMDACVSEAKERGYALTLLGRRRNLSELKSSNYMVRSAAERMAMNTPLQGSAADIIKLAMLGVEKRLENMKSKMILQIHDELIIDTAPDELEEVKKLLSEEMENACKLRVPLIAEAGSAENWGDLK